MKVIMRNPSRSTGVFMLCCLAACAAEITSEAPLDVAVSEEALVGADRHTERIEGDFNGDGRGDFIVVTSAGSFQYLGKAGGAFTENTWTRADLTRGNVHYWTGDFNGDGRVDLLVVTSAGTFQYIAKAAGGFTENVWIRNDLKLNQVFYEVGDFNGDNRDDLIVSTFGGSTELLGLAAGGFFTTSWSRTDLPSTSTSFSVGDFNADGTDDLIIVTPAGSFEYTGIRQRAGRFNENVWSRPDLTVSNVMYTVGNFDGANGDDLIVTTASGSYLYTGRTTGGFTENVWQNTTAGFRRGNVVFATGNFNGPNGSSFTTDLIVTNSSGSRQFLGRPAAQGAGFTDSWNDPALTMAVATFFTSDFTGDGRTDVIIQTSQGSFQYLGKDVGGWVANAWVRNDLTIAVARYF
jgi:hypothetical protein